MEVCAYISMVKQKNGQKSQYLCSLQSHFLPTFGGAIGKTSNTDDRASNEMQLRPHFLLHDNEIPQTTPFSFDVSFDVFFSW